MNRASAKVIAETVTREQLATMFEKAKTSIQDWSIASDINPCMSLGKTWNVMYSVFMRGERLAPIAKKNMVWAFGDYLEDSLKPAKKKRAPKPDVYHEEPVFEVLHHD